MFKCTRAAQKRNEFSHWLPIYIICAKEEEKKKKRKKNMSLDNINKQRERERAPNNLNTRSVAGSRAPKPLGIESGFSISNYILQTQ